MISSDTPSKLAEIIRDTWPQLFWLKKEEPNMIGKLDPEENVMKDILKPYSRYLEFSQVDEIKKIFDTYGWESSDNIVIEMAGTQVSGIDVGEDYNKKWQSPIGTRKYNKDAFIVIKNLSRSPVESSKPMEREHLPHHSIPHSNDVEELKRVDDENGYDTYSK